MADRPIIFSAPMVRAILDGHKTQTRRLVRNMPEPPAHDSLKGEPKHEAVYFDAYCGAKRTRLNPRGMTEDWCWWTRDDRAGRRCRIGFVPGDRLYVREHWKARARVDKYPPKDLTMDPSRIAYLADGEPRDCPLGEWKWGKHRQGMHMPRWASRLTLLVEEVRVERLQAISEADAWAEGVCAAAEHADQQNGKPAWGDIPRHYRQLIVEQTYGSSVQAFRWLWETLHGADSWDANPFVVAVTFSVLHGNIDQIARAA